MYMYEGVSNCIFTNFASRPATAADAPASSATGGKAKGMSSSHDVYVTPPLGPEPSSVNAALIGLHPLPSPALKARASSMLPVPKSCFVTGQSARSKTASRLAPDRWSELSDDVYHLVADHVPTRDLPFLARSSKRWQHMVEAAWPAICARRWPTLRSPLTIPESVLWAVATRGDEDAAIKRFLQVLAELHREWPDAVSVNCDDAGGINNRLCELRGKTSLQLPADAALFWLLGASLEGSSPVATTSGDFGPEYEETTPREPWRVALAWEPLGMLVDEPAVDAAAGTPQAGDAQPLTPVEAFQEAVIQMANTADAAAAVDGTVHEDAVAEDAAAVEGTASQDHSETASPRAPARGPAPPPLYELQSLEMLNEFWEAQVEDVIATNPALNPALDALREQRGAHLLQMANLVTDKMAGTCSMLFVDCRPRATSVRNAAASAEAGSSGSSSESSEGKPSGAWMVVLSGDEDDGDYRFECNVNGEPLSLTMLLELMVGALRSRPDCRGLRWQEAWRRVDLYEYICGALDAPEDDGMSSIMDDGEGDFDFVHAEDDEEGEEGDDLASNEDDYGSEDEDSYPASMLADADELVDDPALDGYDPAGQPESASGDAI